MGSHQSNLINRQACRDHLRYKGGGKHRLISSEGKGGGVWVKVQLVPCYQASAQGMWGRKQSHPLSSALSPKWQKLWRKFAHSFEVADTRNTLNMLDLFQTHVLSPWSLQEKVTHHVNLTGKMVQRWEFSVALSSTSAQTLCSSVNSARITYMSREWDQMKSRGLFKHKVFYEFEKLC